MRLQYCKLLHNTHFTHKLRCMKAQHCPTPHSAIMYLLIGQASLSFGDRNCSDNGNHAWLFTIQVITAGQKQQDAILVGLVEDTLEGTRHYPRCQSDTIGWGWLKMSRSSARHVTNVRANRCVNTNPPHNYVATHP